MVCLQVAIADRVEPLPQMEWVTWSKTLTPGENGNGTETVRVTLALESFLEDVDGDETGVFPCHHLCETHHLKGEDDENEE